MEDEHRRSTLRVALGMRGGVSLAVWIGGGVAELDELRRAHRQEGFYRTLLELGTYDRVEIDVMSGASAGGLNAVLAAACFAGGTPVRSMRDTWLRAGGFERLLDPPGTDDHDRRSLLSGVYFREQVLRSLEQFLGDASTFDHRVDVFLSATALRGVPVGIRDDPFAPDQARRSDALFHFRHHGPTAAESDLAGPAAAGDLAVAARTTASYPVAFEPVCFEPGTLPGVLQLPAATTSAVELLDGGVVDNIPVARALKGVPNIPADTPTDRWIMYLQPSPGLPGVERKVDPGAGAPRIAAVLAGLGNALRSESILDDVEAVRAHNVAAVDSWRAWAASVGTLPEELPEDLGHVDLAYEATRVHALLLDPAAELVWRPIGQAVPGSALAGLSGFERDQLRLALEAAVADLPSSPRPFAAHARVAAFLTRWAREAERATPGLDVSTAKCDAYDLLHLAQLLTVNAEWHALSTTASTSLADGVPAALHTWSEHLRRAQPVAALVTAVVEHRRLAELTGAEAATLRELRACGFAPVPEVAAGAAAGAPEVVDVVAAMWSALGGVARSLAGHEGTTAAITLDLDTGPIVDLARRIGAHPDDAEGYLQLVDARTAGAHEGIAMGLARPFKYVRAAGSNLSPLALDPLDLPHHGPRFRRPGLRQGPGSTAMDASLKLAGSSLANFSAFVSPRWRANDWMWGRLDLVKSIVDVVTSPGRLPADDQQALDAVRRALVGPAAEAGVLAPEVEVAGLALWTAYADVVAAELAAAGSAAPGDRLVTTKRLLVLRRQWEVLAAELPWVQGVPVRPGDLTPAGDPPPVPPVVLRTADQGSAPAGAAPTLQALVDDYEQGPRALSTVWGQGWLTALGMRTAYALWTATLPTSRWKRWLRTPLKPLPMAGLGFLLARHRTLFAVALVLDVLAVPRVGTWLAWVLWTATLVFVAGGQRLCRARTGPPPVPLERWAVPLLVGAWASVVAGAVLASARPGWVFHHLAWWTPGDIRCELTSQVLLAPVVTGLATVVVWHWSPWRWRLLVTVAVAAVFAFWGMWSTVVLAPGASPPVRLLSAIRPLGWAGVAATLLATSIAHRGFRRGTIADYAKG